VCTSAESNARRPETGVRLPPDRPSPATATPPARGRKYVQLPLPDGTAAVSLSFSPSGDALAAACRGRDELQVPRKGIVKVCDAATYQERLSIDPGQWANAVAFSPDGTRLAVACGRYENQPHHEDEPRMPGEVHVYDVKTGERVRSLTHAHGVQAVAFSPDGKLLAAGGGKNRVFDHRTGTLLAEAVGEAHVWDARTWQKVATLEGLTHRVEALAFSPDGQTLAVNDRLFTPSGNAHGVLKVQDADVKSLAFLPDGRLAVHATDNGSRHVVLWDVERRRRAPEPAAYELEGADVAGISADGKTLVLGLSAKRLDPCNLFMREPPGKVVVWDLSSGAKRMSQEEPSGSHSLFGSLAVSPEGERVAVGIHYWDGDNYRNAVKIWPIRKR
jgi:WD40 repeat protein